MNKITVTCAALLATFGAHAHEAAQLDPIGHTLAHAGHSGVMALAIGAVVVTGVAALLRTVKNNPPRR